MLIKCSECELQVSDKAILCPHCGFPLKQNIKQPKRPAKRKRLPNGFGQISEIRGRNLRNRFRAMVTVGKTPEGRPIVKPLKPKSFFATYNDAYMALAEYNKSPYDLSPSMTLADVYEKWIDGYQNEISNKTFKNIRTSWTHLKPLYGMGVADIKVRHIKGVIEDESIAISTKHRVKFLLSQILDFALQNELVTKNYAKDYKLPSSMLKEERQNRKSHISFEKEEMDTLWREAENFRGAKLILIQCFSGWRPQEMGSILLENVDLENWFFKGGMKTEAGTNRNIPIHPAIRDFVKEFYDESVSVENKYLITNHAVRNDSKFMNYDSYKWLFDKTIKALGLNPEHRSHDPRVQFVSMCKKYNVDEYAIKYMAGHEIDDITEKIYTKREPSWLMAEICKIKIE